MSRGEGLVPCTNRGLKGSDDTALCIDYCTFTAPLGLFLRQSGQESHLRSCAARPGWQRVVAERLFWHYFNGLAAPGLTLDSDYCGHYHAYTCGFRIVSGYNNGRPIIVGHIAFGGEHQRDTYLVELSGAGCALIEDWQEFHRRLDDDGVRLTRVDVAFDDFKGVHHLGHVRQWYDAGEFTSNGRPPAIQECGWEDGTGKTLYVGKNKGNQQLCAYEKGKQLGDPSSPWVRFEARFGAKYRDIPRDILLKPGEFFVGHYKVFEGIVSDAGQRMRTHVKRASSSLIKAMFNARRQYGGLLELLRRNATNTADYGRMVELLTKPKLPAWVTSLPYSYHAATAACANEFNSRRNSEGFSPC